MLVAAWTMIKEYCRIYKTMWQIAWSPPTEDNRSFKAWAAVVVCGMSVLAMMVLAFLFGLLWTLLSLVF